MGIMCIIKEWLLSLGLGEKISGAIISLGTTGLLKRVHNIFKSAPEKQAFKRAVKKWKKQYHLSGICNNPTCLKTINDFCNYVINNHGAINLEVMSLYDYFEKELEKTDGGKMFLQELRTKALNKDQYENLIKTQEIIDAIKDLRKMQNSILKELNTHNKGIREFSPIDGYIQRYCTQRMENDEVFSYLMEHKTIEHYKLTDVVSGRTECKGNKFILYSEAQTGKTTELMELGWELKNEGKLIPIMFKIKGCHSIRQELPVLNKDIEKGIVVIIDALDEKFDGDTRYGIYNEVDTYAEEHPDLTIVLTCRENFCNEHSFKGFTKLTLSDLSWQDSVDYLKSEGIEEIIADIESKNLYEFVRTPFYLIALCDFYKEKNCLPEKKVELYEFFIDRRLNQEEELGLKQSAEMLSRGKALLQKTAVAIQLMGTSCITKDDSLVLFDRDYEDYNRVLRTGLIEVAEGNGYGFTHNSFKEFFVSNYLLRLGKLDKIQKLCCYVDTQIVKVGWFNTIALLLSQLSKESELSKQIIDWIVSENKNMVMYVDRKLFDEQQRIGILKDIIEYHKSKRLRFADLASSKYEDLMNFGSSVESIDYLMEELKGCQEIDNHAVNVLYLLRYLRYEDLTPQKAVELNKLLLEVFSRFKDDNKHIFVLFEVFMSPWLKNESNVDAIYAILKDSKHPNIVNHLVEYLLETGYAEKYIDSIIEKSKYIHDYNEGGYTRIVRKEVLFRTYQTLFKWNGIKKALKQLIKDYKGHLYGAFDEDNYDDQLKKMLEKVEGMIDEHPDAPDFVYELLIELAADGGNIRRIGREGFQLFFERTGLSQCYFDRSIESLKNVFFDNKIDYDLGNIESNAYCAALLLNKTRLEQLKRIIDFTKPYGDSLLSYISQFASVEMQKEIDVISKKYYPQNWRRRNEPSKWLIMAQQEFDELMDYERFKSRVLKVLEETAPKNKEDMKLLRNTKLNLSNEGVSRYVFWVYNRFYNQDEKRYELTKVRDYIEDYNEYQKLVVRYVAENLYTETNKIEMNDGQRQLFIESTVFWLKKMGEKPYMEGFMYKQPALMVLLHHDVNVDDELLLHLLPYSYFSINIKMDWYNNKDYSLFDYISERFVDKQTKLLDALRGCMDMPVKHVEQNWKEWGIYLVKKKVASEYGRVINQMVAMPCADSSLSLVKVLLENDETRPILLKDDVMKRCEVQKRLFIYEQLASDVKMDEYVVKNLEKDFDYLDDDDRYRAIRIMLLKGSMKGLEYVEKNVDLIDFRIEFGKYTENALPMLMTIYVKAIDIIDSSDCTSILNAVESIALETDEGWKKVNKTFIELIEGNEKKFSHLNWYLQNWMVKRMEKASPVMSVSEVKMLLNGYNEGAVAS